MIWQGLRQRIGIAAIMAVLTGTQAWASCDDHLRKNEKKPIHIIKTEREGETGARFDRAVGALFGPGKILDQLGLQLPEQFIKMLAGREMDAMAGLGRHALRHWHDGGEVLKMLRSRSGVIYEFVASQAGCQASYFRDTLPFAHQMSIVFHVIGHQVFALSTRFRHVRDVDTIGESLAANDLLEDYYRRYDHDEVSLWYQKLLSLVEQQDMARGTFDRPEELRRADRKSTAPTASLLQAFVATPPNGLPAWKLELARAIERLHRHYSGSAPTKIMNEGFATLLQELIAEHTDHNTFGDALEVGDLLHGVLHGGLSNVYNLGLSAWRRVRERFNVRPEVQGLLPLERDKQFLAYARDEIIAKMDSHQFLLFALDHHWVVENRLMLTKAIPWPTKDIGEPSPDLKDPEPKKIITRNADQVVAELIHQLADFSKQIPRIVRKDSNYQGRAILLESDSPTGRQVPLERTTMVATLFEDAGLFQRPVILKTVVLESWATEGAPRDTAYLRSLMWPIPEPFRSEKVVNVEVEVSPNGEVQARQDGTVVEKLTADLQERLTAYRAYQQLGFEDFNMRQRREEMASTRQTLEAVATAVAGSVAAHVPGTFLVGAPTAPGAILEYQNLFERRVSAAFGQAVSGKGWLSRGNMVRLQAMPLIPSFAFDNRARQLLEDQETEQEVALLSSAVQSRKAVAVKSRSGRFEITYGDGRDGDEYWGERPPRKGEGEGEEEGEGDPSEGNKPGELPGRDPADPSVVEIPPELYGRLLGEQVILPNLRPKSGKSQVKEEERGGRATRANGELLTDEIRKKAYAIGRVILLRSSDPEDAKNVQKCIVTGLRNLERDEYVVKDWERVKTPEINAQVTFAIDLSGSMGSDLSKLAKILSYDLGVLIKNKYKKVEFRFVTFDSEGHVYESADEFFRAQLGGGTDYTAGFGKIAEVQEAFPRSKWDRFVFVMGDLEDGGELGGGVVAAERVRDQSEYLGILWTHRGSGWRSTIQEVFRQWAESEPWVGYAEASTASPGQVTFDVLKKLLKN